MLALVGKGRGSLFGCRLSLRFDLPGLRSRRSLAHDKPLLRKAVAWLAGLRIVAIPLASSDASAARDWDEACGIGGRLKLTGLSERCRS